MNLQSMVLPTWNTPATNVADVYLRHADLNCRETGAKNKHVLTNMTESPSNNNQYGAIQHWDKENGSIEKL